MKKLRATVVRLFKTTDPVMQLSFNSNPFGFSLLSKNVKIKINKTIILPLVLYWRQTWSLTLRNINTEGKRCEMLGGWRKLHNEELHDLYSSPNIIRMTKSKRMRWARHVTHLEKRESHIGFWWESQRRKETTSKT
jgi:hypothetical protein